MSQTSSLSVKKKHRGSGAQVRVQTLAHSASTAVAWATTDSSPESPISLN